MDSKLDMVKKYGRRAARSVGRAIWNFGQGPGSGPGSMQGTARLSGRHYVSWNTTSAIQSLDLNPSNLDDRCIGMAELFQEFRFTSLQLTAISFGVKSSTTGAYHSVAYQPVKPPNNPAGLEEMMDCPLWCAGDGTVGFPWPTIRVRRHELNSGVVPWHRVSTAADDLFETQGTMYYKASYATDVSILWIEYDVEFRNPIDPVLVPAQRSDRHAQVQTSPSVDEGEEKKTTAIARPRGRRLG